MLAHYCGEEASVANSIWEVGIWEALGRWSSSPFSVLIIDEVVLREDNPTFQGAVCCPKFLGRA
jgi:hypothetical protein